MDQPDDGNCETHFLHSLLKRGDKRSARKSGGSCRTCRSNGNQPIRSSQNSGSFFGGINASGLPTAVETTALGSSASVGCFSRLPVASGVGGVAGLAIACFQNPKAIRSIAVQ